MFLKNYRYVSKKQLKKENVELKEALEKEEKATFEDYFNKNTTISTNDGLAINFKGTELVQIFAGSFWDLVKDSDNYVICDLYASDGKSVEVTVKKKGKLSPQAKLRKVEGILTKLLEECVDESDIALEAYNYLSREKELKQKYAKK